MKLGLIFQNQVTLDSPLCSIYPDSNSKMRVGLGKLYVYIAIAK